MRSTTVVSSIGAMMTTAKVATLSTRAIGNSGDSTAARTRVAPSAFMARAQYGRLLESCRKAEANSTASASVRNEENARTVSFNSGCVGQNNSNARLERVIRNMTSASRYVTYSR